MTMMTSRKRLAAFLALTGIIALTALKLSGVGPPQSHPPSARNTWVESQASQVIFFAVFEGLYRDGVTNADVDLIIPPGRNGRPTFDSEHFVYACPLCHPAYEAFKLYRQREQFYGFKGRVDTLGTGLDDAIRQRLQSKNPADRRKAVEDLINRWVGERLDMMRLSADERRAITSEMEQGRKKGMNGLKQASAGSSHTRTNCPICDGSFSACKLRPQ
jgi:hypothetical protein